MREFHWGGEEPGVVIQVPTQQALIETLRPATLSLSVSPHIIA